MKYLPNGQQVYADSTMKSWTKEELVKYVRMCERNITALAERVENQAKLLKEICLLILRQRYKALGEQSEISVGLWRVINAAIGVALNQSIAPTVAQRWTRRERSERRRKVDDKK